MFKKLRFAVALILGAILISFLITPSIQAQTFSEWEEIGPTGISWDTKIIAHPSSPEIAFFIDGNSLFRTNDRGESWMKVKSGITRDFKFQFSEQNENVVYIFNKHIYKSVDKGVNWETLYSSEVYTISYINPEDENFLMSQKEGKFYKSKDKGGEWISLVDNLEYWDPGFDNSGPYKYGDTYRFWHNPKNSDVIIGQQVRISGDIRYELNLHVTYDKGMTWDSLDIGGFGETIYADFVVDQIYFHPSDSLVMYARTKPEPLLRKTTDGGKNWFSISDSLFDPDQYYSLNYFMIDPNNADILYASAELGVGQQYLFRSNNAGVTWSILNQFQRSKAIISLSKSESSADEFYALSFPDNIIYSNDNGETWSNITDGFNYSSVDYLKVDQGNSVYAGVDDRGVFLFNEKEDWANIYANGSSNPPNIVVSKSTPNFVFARIDLLSEEGIRSAFSISENNGLEWVMNEPDTLRFSDQFDVASDNKTVYGSVWILNDEEPSHDAIIKSTNAGNNWEVIEVLGTTEDQNTRTALIDQISIDPSDSDVVYMRSYLSGDISKTVIAKTDNGGLDWNIIFDPEVTYYRSVDYSISRNNSNTIYGFAENELYKSENKGETWVMLDTIGSIQIQDLEEDLNNENIFYALSSGKIYMSTKGGTDWVDILGENGCCFNDLAVISVNETTTALYAATNGQGVKRMIISGIPTSNETEESSPKTFSLSQNYPNPFNPSTTISYTLEQAGKVNLSVFNTIGQRVYTAVDEVRNAGSNSATIDLRGLSSGVYFYTLTSGEFTETRKMVLLK